MTFLPYNTHNVKSINLKKCYLVYCLLISVTYFSLQCEYKSGLPAANILLCRSHLPTESCLLLVYIIYVRCTLQICFFFYMYIARA